MKEIIGKAEIKTENLSEESLLEKINIWKKKKKLRSNLIIILSISDLT